MMIPQYTAASIVSQNKQLCTPSSVDSIVSSNGQEDHVSMGAVAGCKVLKTIENTALRMQAEHRVPHWMGGDSGAQHLTLQLATQAFMLVLAALC